MVTASALVSVPWTLGSAVTRSVEELPVSEYRVSVATSASSGVVSVGASSVNVKSLAEEKRAVPPSYSLARRRIVWLRG
jgi:hypothetical protein